MQATSECHVRVTERPQQVTVTTPDGKTHTARWRGVDNTPDTLRNVQGDKFVCFAALSAWAGEKEWTVQLGDLRHYSEGWGLGEYDAAAQS